MERAIADRRLDDCLEIVPNTVGQLTGMWSLKASKSLSPISTLIAEKLWNDESAAMLLAAAAAAPGWTLILMNGPADEVPEILRELSAPALWEPRVAVVSGCFSDAESRHALWSGGLFTPAGVIDPGRGQAWAQGGYHGRLFCQRCVDVASPADVLISNDKLSEGLAFLRDLNVPVSGDSLMVGLGILSARADWLVAVTPAVRRPLPIELRHTLPVDRLGLAGDVRRRRWYNVENSTTEPFVPSDYGLGARHGGLLATSAR